MSIEDNIGEKYLLTESSIENIAKNNPLTYYLVGSLPGKMQERVSKKWGRKINYYCLWNLAFVSGLTALKYLGKKSFSNEGIESAGYMTFYGLTALGVASNLIRGTYLAVKRKPIGDLFLELAFNMFGGTKKVTKILKKTGLEELALELDTQRKIINFGKARQKVKKMREKDA